MTAPNPDFAQFSMLIVCAGLGGLVMIVSGTSTIYKNLIMARTARNPPRNPPSEEEAARTYATKSELTTLKCELAANCRANHERVDKTFGELFSIHRNLNKELTDRLDQYHGELASWQRSVERQIGTIEGKMINGT